MIGSALQSHSRAQQAVSDLHLTFRQCLWSCAFSHHDLDSPFYADRLD